jgi:hypothetical protein
MFKVVMAKGRKLKKFGGDLEVQKQSVVSLELTIGEQNVPFELGVDESNNGFNLELANDEITPNLNWEFQSKSGGLNCLKIYIH